jgi:hypothetical protein
MDSSVQTGFIIAAITIGCAMQPIQGHDPAAARLSGRNPLSAINDVLRTREQRRLEGKCFGSATRAVFVGHPNPDMASAEP